MRISPKRYAFEFADWNLYRSDETSLVYRPSLRTLLRRLTWSFVAAALLVVLQFGFGQASNRLTFPINDAGEPSQDAEVYDFEQRAVEMRDSLRTGMTDSEWQEFEAREAANRAKNQAEADAVIAERERLLEGMRYAVLAFTALLAALAILPPLLASIEQITVARDVRGNFVVTRRRIASRAAMCPVSTLTPFKVLAQGSSTRGYQWIVTTESDAARAGTGDAFGFHVGHSKQAPILADPLPDRVAAFVDGMHRVTGVSHEGPTVLDTGARHRSRFRVRADINVNRGRTVRSQTFTNLDDIPPEFRADIEAMMSGSGSRSNPVIERHVMKTQHITVKDAEGNVRTYTSPEEMPPDMRAIFEEMRRKHGPGLQ